MDPTQHTVRGTVDVGGLSVFYRSARAASAPAVLLLPTRDGTARTLAGLRSVSPPDAAGNPTHSAVT